MLILRIYDNYRADEPAKWSYIQKNLDKWKALHPFRIDETFSLPSPQKLKK